MPRHPPETAARAASRNMAAILEHLGEIERGMLSRYDASTADWSHVAELMPIQEGLGDLADRVNKRGRYAPEEKPKASWPPRSGILLRSRSSDR